MGRDGAGFSAAKERNMKLVSRIAHIVSIVVCLVVVGMPKMASATPRWAELVKDEGRHGRIKYLEYWDDHPEITYECIIVYKIERLIRKGRNWKWEMEGPYTQPYWGGGGTPRQQRVIGPEGFVRIYVVKIYHKAAG
jgi:hypothetical protein